jgi:hypothetical protein
MILSGYEKLLDIKWHVCILCSKWFTPVILNCGLWLQHCSISCQVVGINPAEDMIVSSPLRKPQSRKRRNFVFLSCILGIRRQQFEHCQWQTITLCRFVCASEDDGISQSSVRALSKGGKARCHMHCCWRVYILHLFSGFIAFLLWTCVCVCVCVYEKLLPLFLCPWFWQYLF